MPERMTSLRETTRAAIHESLARENDLGDGTVLADAALIAVGQRMDEIAIVEPVTTWEAAYKHLRREVGALSTEGEG